MFALISNTRARLRQEEKGATAVEYGIMVALIAVVIIAAVTLLGGTMNKTFMEAQCAITGTEYKAAVEESGTAGSPGHVPASDAKCE